MKRREVQRLDASAFQIHHDQPVIAGVEGAGHDLAGLPETAQNHERLAHPAHLPLEPLQTERLPEAAVLQQRQHRPDGVGPGHHGQVDRDDHPHALRSAEGVRDLPETDRGRGVAHEVEGLERVHPPDLAVHDLSGDQRQAEDADREQADEHDQRCPHLAQNQEDRRCAGTLGRDPAHRRRGGHLLPPERHGLHNQQGDRDDVGEQSTPGQRDDAGDLFGRQLGTT